MKKGYRNYLIVNGFKLVSDSGINSTVDDYVNRIERICNRENMDWQTLANNIEEVLAEYETVEEKIAYAKTSNEAPLNALRHFNRFTKEEVK